MLNHHHKSTAISSGSSGVYAGKKAGVGALARSPYQDYRQPSFYMVTITTHQRRHLFGTCVDNRAILNETGWMVYHTWHRISQDYPAIETSTLCIMPDHLHGILRARSYMEKPLGVAIRAFKSQCTSALRKAHNDSAFTLWEPGYFDLCAAGRLLIICGCTTTPSDSTYKLSRADCLIMNDSCRSIAQANEGAA